MPFKTSLVGDAWIKEAREASKLVEDVEGRIKNKDLAQEHGVRESAKTKLLEAGVKLDRLESLLLNPPSKPIITDEDLIFRWKMLSDFRVRTAELAHILYASRSTKRQGGSLDADAKETNRTADVYNQDQRPLFSRHDAELRKPLVIAQTGSEDSMSSQRKLCHAISLILAVAALLFALLIPVSKI